MYCGDETGAFVGDVGYSTCKFGYGGEDLPKMVIPSMAGHLDNSLNVVNSGLPRHRPNLELKYVHQRPNYDDPNLGSLGQEYLEMDGIISNWDVWEACWNKAMTDLRVRDRQKWTLPSVGPPNDILEQCPHPICAVQPGYTHNSAPRQVEHIVERLFELYGAPAVFVVPSPAVSAFSVGRPTSLVVDVGGAGCRVTPVFDGLLMNTAQRRSGRGGEWLSDQQYHILTDLCGRTLHPRHAIGSSLGSRLKTVKYPTDTTRSYHWCAMHDLMLELKTGPHISLDDHDDDYEDMYSDAGRHLYELPDGTTVNLKAQPRLKTLPDLLCMPASDPFFARPDKSSISSSDSISMHHHSTWSTASLTELIHDSLSAVDIDVRKELCSNIILVGASSLFAHFNEKVSRDLSTKWSPTYFKAKIITANPLERQFSSWIGASVLTSLGSFQQMWCSRAEYEEYGVTLACTKFPS